MHSYVYLLVVKIRMMYQPPGRLDFSHVNLSLLLNMLQQRKANSDSMLKLFLDSLSVTFVIIIIHEGLPQRILRALPD